MPTLFEICKHFCEKIISLTRLAKSTFRASIFNVLFLKDFLSLRDKHRKLTSMLVTVKKLSVQMLCQDQLSEHDIPSSP